MSAAVPATPPARPRRRIRVRRGAGWLALLLVLVLLGRGLGWLGSGPSPRPDPVAAVEPGEPGNAAAGIAAGAPTGSAARPPAADPGADPGAAMSPPSDGAPATPKSVEAAAADPAAAESPAVPPPAPPGAASPDETPRAPTLATDRFASLVSVVEHGIAESRFGSALAALARLAAAALDAQQAKAVAAIGERVDTALRAACGDLLQRLGRGEVLAARDLYAGMAAGGAELFAERFAALARERGMPAVAVCIDRLDRPVPSAERPWPVPRTLSRNRELRVAWSGQLLTGAVVDSRVDGVTVRLTTATGQSFPTVAVARCEPIAATAPEAVEMALVALHAGDPALARLWLIHAHLAEPNGLDARGQAVGELLR